MHSMHSAPRCIGVPRKPEPATDWMWWQRCCPGSWGAPINRGAARGALSYLLRRACMEFLLEIWYNCYTLGDSTSTRERAGA